MIEKIKASLLHLIFSALSIGLFVGITLLHFYPSVFFDIESPYQALIILIPADIVLGPLLTLIIYKKGKWGLKFDLIAIIICQLIALGYGCWAIYSTRPGFLVLHGDTFYTAPPTIDQTFLRDTPLEVGAFNGPKIVYLSLPGSISNHLVLTVESISDGIPIQWRSQYFKDINTINTDDLRSASMNIEALKRKSTPETLARINMITQSATSYAFIPVVGTKRPKVIAINISTKQAEYTFDINPF